MTLAMAGWAEADWERTTEYLTVDAPTVARLLGAPVGRVTLLTGGKANTNYKIEVADGPLVLRLYERDPSAADREQRLLDLVGDAMPTPRRRGVGTTETGVPYALFDFVHGEHPHRVMTQSNARAIGVALGRSLAGLEAVTPPGDRVTLGLLSETLGFTETFESVESSFLDLIGSSLRHGPAADRLGELAASLVSKLDVMARRLAAVDTWRGLVHGDYKFSNILVRDTRTAAVLDWEFACAFTPLLDVAIMMRHRDSFPPDYVAGFEDGHGALPDDWRTLSRVIDLMNLVGFLNGPIDRPRLFQDVRERIAVTLSEF